MHCIGYLRADLRDYMREMLSALGQSAPPVATERQLARRFGQPELRIKKHSRRITGTIRCSQIDIRLQKELLDTVTDTYV